MASKKKFSELGSASKALIIIGSIVEMVLTSVALADLRRRARPAVRGPKWIWGLVCLVQPIGPVLYLLFGRRDTGS